ncbi:MAG: hypothetical protein M1336_06835 [Deltaproteobacteria bacterium]|jgi:hypothetical protein|nr:hypothetical protein [Deltaproteobacteria bacterium]
MSKYAQQILFSYRRTCRRYEENTSPHYRAQKQRFARRRRRERAREQQEEAQQQP